MEETVAELHRQNKELEAGIANLADTAAKEKRSFTPEEKTAWEKLNTDYNAISERLAVQERAAKIKKDREDEHAKLASFTKKPVGVERSESVVTEDHRQLALKAWALAQCRREIPTNYMDACKRLNFNPQVRELNIDLMADAARQSCINEMRTVYRGRHDEVIHRAMSSLHGTLGGNVVTPASLASQIEVNMLAYGGVEQVATVMTTQTGERLEWPIADDTSNQGARIGENTQIAASVEPSFTTIAWDAYTYYSKPVNVPYNLLEDAIFDIGSFLGTALPERISRKFNTECTTGNGNSMPKGIVTAATAGVTAASATAVTMDELMALEHSVDSAYRTAGCGWMMNDATLLYLRTLKDGQGRPLWGSVGQDGYLTGSPDRLLGYPIYINHDMASMASATVPILFGQMARYKIRRVKGIRLYHMTERYRDYDQDAFVAYVRQDGNYMSPITPALKKLTMAA